MLNNGMGGIDWAGLPVAVELYRVRDVEGLVERLLVAKAYKKPADEEKD
jgi:hypothetical protein